MRRLEHVLECQPTERLTKQKNQQKKTGSNISRGQVWLNTLTQALERAVQALYGFLRWQLNNLIILSSSSCCSFYPVTNTSQCQINERIDVVGHSSVVWAADRKAWRITDAGSIPGVARDFLPESAFSADSCGVRTAPRLQSHASILARPLKAPNNGSHIPLFGHRKI